MFEKEKDGRKPNTFRKIDEFDERFESLFNDCRLITIENVCTGECFQRKITDVSVWDGWMIISWEHENEK